MDLQAFKDSLNSTTPPAELSPALQALWHDAKGDWHAAHATVQPQEDQTGAAVHAYLHRKEGDLSNAAYWYRRAGLPVADDSLEAEWERLVQTLLQRSDADRR